MIKTRKIKEYVIKKYEKQEDTVQQVPFTIDEFLNEITNLDPEVAFADDVKKYIIANIIQSTLDGELFSSCVEFIGGNFDEKSNYLDLATETERENQKTAFEVEKKMSHLLIAEVDNLEKKLFFEAVSGQISISMIMNTLNASLKVNTDLYYELEPVLITTFEEELRDAERVLEYVETFNSEQLNFLEENDYHVDDEQTCQVILKARRGKSLDVEKIIDDIKKRPSNTFKVTLRDSSNALITMKYGEVQAFHQFDFEIDDIHGGVDTEQFYGTIHPLLTNKPYNLVHTEY